MLLAYVAHMRRLGDISDRLSLVHPHSLIMMMHLFSLSFTMLTTTSSLSMGMAPFIVWEVYRRTRALLH